MNGKKYKIVDTRGWPWQHKEVGYIEEESGTSGGGFDGLDPGEQENLYCWISMIFLMVIFPIWSIAEVAHGDDAINEALKYVFFFDLLMAIPCLIWSIAFPSTISIIIEKLKDPNETKDWVWALPFLFLCFLLFLFFLYRSMLLSFVRGNL